MAASKIAEIIKQKPNFASEIINGECILVPVKGKMAEFNTMLTLNPSASYLWETMNKSSTLPDLAEALTRKYEIDPASAAADAAEFVNELYAFMTGSEA